MADDTGGLLGFFTRGYDPAAAYGGLLSDQGAKDAMMARALAGMAGAFGQGAMPSPYKGGTPFLATLGQAAQAAYGGQDELIKARNLASESLLRGTQADVARQNLDLNRTLLKARLGQLDAEEKTGGGPGAKTGPAKILSEAKGTVFDTGDPFLNLTAYHESGYRPNIGTGENDLSGHALDANGFPIWKGIDTPKGNSSAAGLFQITRTNWNTFAPPLIQAGVMKPDFSVESQIAVAKAMRAANGTADWLPYNKPLAEAHARGDVVKVPGSPASTEAAPPRSLLAEVPHYTTFGEAPGAEPPLATAGAPAAPRPAQPPGVSLNSRGEPISQDLTRDLPGQRIGAAAVAPNPSFAPTSPAIEAARAATAREFGPAQVPGRQGLLGPEPGAPPPALAAARAPDAPVGGLLGPRIPEAIAALAQQVGGRPAQFAGPGAADPTVPPVPPPPAVPSLLQGGGARPPIAPVTGPMPPMPPSLLTQPGPAGPPPAAPPMPGPLPGAGMPPMPVQPAPGAPAPALPGGAPTPQQIIAAKRVAAIQEAMGRPVDPITAKIANFNIEAAQAGANAAQTAAAQQPYTQGNAAYDAQVKAQYQVWVDRMKPREIRPGAIDIDPVTQQTRYNPAVIEGTDPKTGDKFHYHSYPSMTPGGVPTLVPIMQSGIGPGTTQTLTQTAAAQPITVGNQVMQRGPGYTEPITTPAGSTIPPASTAAPITGTKPNLDKRGEQFATIENDWGKSVAPAAQAVNRVEAIMSAMKSYETGTWASKKSEIVGMLKSVGINLGNAVDDPAQAQIILKNNFGTALNIMQSTGLSRWTQAELFGAQANSANPDLWAKANHAIGAQTIGVIDWEQQMLKDYRAYKKYDPGMVDPHDFQQRWVEANPLQAYVDRAHERIGPLKGEPGAETPQTYRHPSGQIYPSRTVPDGKGGFKQQYLQP